ncbi:MAG TPA: DUF4432 family protein [Acidobacteriaceae bacterium]|jgi:hypothetical protein|nr:DUF4432 family protein [Acidobacteriaceae bacterium]
MDSPLQRRDATGTSVVKGNWRGREAVILSNGVVRLTVLRTGGLLAEFGSVANDGACSRNLLWESPWSLRTPRSRSDEELQRLYGDVGAGRFLERFTGHALCLDEFGSASDEEVAAGSGLHGEASLVDWSFSEQEHDSVTATAELPLARLSVERRFSLCPGESVIRVEERITNRSDQARPLHWVQHATVGPPMFGEGALVATSAMLGTTASSMYGERDLLEPAAAFVWPYVPGAHGAMIDLRRPFQERSTGFVAAVRQPAEREHGFVAAMNSAERVALMYVFAADDFPWLTVWEENDCRQEYPWDGKVQARGLEFGTTPLPLGKEIIDAAGPVLGYPTSRRIDSGATVSARWIMATATGVSLPSSIDDIVVEDDFLLLASAGEKIRVAARGVASFFVGLEEA